MNPWKDRSNYKERQSNRLPEKKDHQKEQTGQGKNYPDPTGRRLPLATPVGKKVIRNLTAPRV